MNYFKAMLSVLLMFVSSLYSVAQEGQNSHVVMAGGSANAKVMIVTTMDGKKTKLGLKNTPIITIEPPYLVYKSDVAEARFELDQLWDIKYEDVTPILGDASGDGVINRADVDETVQYIFGKPSGDFIFSNADTNHDQKVNAADIVQISDLVKNPNINDISKSRNATNSDKQASYNQQRQYAIYNYRNDNDFNAFLNIDIDKIIYSNIGLDGTEYKNAVVQEVWTPDSVYRIPIQAIDSIGFRAPEPVVKDGVFHITEDHCPYVIDTEDLSITFNSSIPVSMLPQRGQIVISDVYGEMPFESGFAGRVKSIINKTNMVKIECDEVSLDDIYDQIICVGRTITYSGDPSTNNTRFSIEKDGTLGIELLPIKIKIKDPDEESSDMSIDLDITPSLSLDYTIVYNVKGMDNHFKIVLKPQLDFDIDFKYKSKLIGDKILKMEKSYIPLKTTIPGLYAKLKWGGFFDYEGNLSVVGKLSYKSVLNAGYDSAKEDYLGFVFNNDGSEWEEPDVSVSMNGYVYFGPAFQLVACLVSEKWLPSFTITAKPGCKLSGKFEINDDMFTGESVSVYDALKDSKVSCSGELSIEGEANVFGEKFTLPSTEWKPEWLKQDFYLFPNFTEATLLDMSEIQGTKYSPSFIYSEVSRNLFLPCKIGMAVYDLEGNKVRENFNEERYWFEKDGSKSIPEERVNRVGVNMRGLPSNSMYKVCPIVKSVLPLFDIERASPTTFFQIPLSLELEQNSLNLGVGQGKELSIFRGWGDYKVLNMNPDLVNAQILTHELENGTLAHGIFVEAKKTGQAFVIVQDLRSNEQATLSVKVEKDLIPSSTIFINTKKIDFGTMNGGESKTEYFSVVNSGDYDLKFIVEKASAPFYIPESGTEVTLAAGDTKVFAVTCSGLESGDGLKTQFIHITSDASNASADFGFMLSANGGESEPEAPYIPVQTETIVVKGVPFTMVAVEGGSFMMGSPDDDPDAGGIYSDEKPQHRVKLSNFAIGQTEVTQALWKVVMGDNPSSHKGYKKPVEWVSWDKCQTFISKLNALTGRTFRLPTEAEWEYAARGGKNSKGYKYAGSNDIDEVAWNINNSEETTHIVGTKNPNELGLYDMSGNVWEWCQDWYDWTYYSNSPEINPCNTTEVTSDDEADHQHIHRGGSISYIIKDLRNAMRGDFKNEPSLYLKGLRLVISDGKKGYKETTADDEAYAAYYNGTLSFYCDGDRFSKSGETYDMPDYKSSPDWRDIRESVKRVIFDSSFAKARPKCTMAWFADMSTITKIEGLQYLNTSEVTFMSEMFYKCSSIKTLDVSHFNTSKVTYMGNMFEECSSLTSLDVSHFNTSKVTNMQSMFRKCSSLTGLDVSNFDTSRTTTMSNLFAGCSNLTTLDVSHFDTSQTTDMYSMFWGCSGLSGIDVSNFNTSKVTNMTWMFGGCSSLNSIDISSFDISGLVDGDDENALQGMFYDCNNLKTIKCGELWNMKSTANSSDMFIGCTSLVGGQGTKYDSNHTDGEYARIDGGSYKPGYFTNVNNVFTLSGESLTLKPNSVSSIYVLSGSGSYTAVSSNPEVATVQIGYEVFAVTAIKVGSATITVSDTQWGQTKTFTVKVLGDEDAFCLSESSIEIYVNTDKVVSIKNGSGDYDIINDYPDIIEADINGIHVAHSRNQQGTRTPSEEGRPITDDLLYITGKKIGNAVLKIKDKLTGEIVSINVAIVKAPSLTLAKNHVELNVGETENVEILSGSEWYEVTTDNPNVVSVRKATISTSGGGRDEDYSYTGTYAIIEALSAGDAIVTVKDLSSSEELTISVTSEP